MERVDEISRAREDYGWDERQLNKERLQVALRYSGQHILEAGCSDGKYIRYFLRDGYDAFGFDLLMSAQWRDGRFLVCDIGSLPFKHASFDTIICYECLEHVQEVDRALEECYRITRSNIIVSVPDCREIPVLKNSGLALHHWVDRTHCQFFTEESLVKALKRNGFDICYFTRINPVTLETAILDSYRLPLNLARKLGFLARKLGFRRRIYMTLLAVACKI